MQGNIIKKILMLFSTYLEKTQLHASSSPIPGRIWPIGHIFFPPPTPINNKNCKYTQIGSFDRELPVSVLHTVLRNTTHFK